MKFSSFLHFSSFGIKTILFRRKKPILGTIIVTDKCNLKCKHCSVNNIHAIIAPYSQIKSEMTTQYVKLYYKDNNSFDLVNTRSESYKILHWYYAMSDQHLEKMQEHIFNESNMPRKPAKINEFEIKLIKRRKPTEDEIIRVKYKYLHNEQKIKKEEHNLTTIKNCIGESEPNESKIKNNKGHNLKCGKVNNRGGCVDISNSTSQQKNWKVSNKGNGSQGGNVDCDKYNCACKQHNRSVNENHNHIQNVPNNSQTKFNSNNNKKGNGIHNNCNNTPNNSNISTTSNSNPNEKKSNSRNHSKEDKECQIVQNDINDAIGINNKEHLSPQMKSPIRPTNNGNSNKSSHNIITIKKGKATPLNRDKIEIKLKKAAYTSPHLLNNNILCVTSNYINREIKPKEQKRTCPCHRHLDSSNYINQQHQHPKNISIRLNYSHNKNHSQQHNYQIKVKLPQSNTHSQLSSSINKMQSSSRFILEQ